MRRGLSVLLSLVVGVAVVAVPSAAAAVTWGPCVDGPARMVCATVRVPVDWSRPRGETVGIAVAKLPATGRRIGSLVVNPGGPGGSGVDMAANAEARFSAELTAGFDIVGFDPRGQGRSHTYVCDVDLVDRQIDLLVPASAADFAALLDANRALGRNCEELTGRLARHMDTASVARDVDAIRAALGERTISYYGVSYGTMIGQQYAELFPHRLRALALDSSMDHSLGIRDYQVWETRAQEGAFLRFAAWCERTADCALHDEDVVALYDGLVERAAAGELVFFPGTEAERVPTPTDLAGLLFSSMYDPADWFTLARSLRQLDEEGVLLPAVRGRGEPVPYGYQPVMCQDFRFDLRSYAELARLERDLWRLAPHAGPSALAWSDLTGCQRWPGPVVNPPHRLVASPSLPPILMTNSRYDVATPYQWARHLAAQLPSATLLTYDGVGHGNYRLSSCARAAVDAYLLTLRLPRQGKHCPAIYPTASLAAAGSVRPLTR